MLVDVKVPYMTKLAGKATLLTWHKREGESVARDESLIEIETDKVVLDVAAPQSGVIARIVKQDGSAVAMGDVIAIIDTP